MWENYIPRESPARPIPISKEMYDAVKKFSADKKCGIQFTFDSGLISIWRIWNGDNEINDSESHSTEMKVRSILMNNPPPGEIKRRKKGKHLTPCFVINIRFTGDMTFEWINHLERLKMIHGIEDGIRRILSWHLREQGYL